MKKIICSLFMYLLVSTSVVFAEGDPILLMSEAPIGPLKAPIPITAELSDGQLIITFMANIGLVDINVVNDMNVVVHQEDVDTDAIFYVDISTTSWSPGDYVLILILENGTRLSGKFSL